jgi:NAD(P)-dependent dehydrogenase (short-subunit alcohol dehydrogenase family)
MGGTVSTTPTPLSGKVAVVVGSSRGIGAVTAQAFAARGAAVALAARDQAALEAVCAGIRERGGRAIAIRTDVTDPEAVRLLVERTVDEYGRLDAAFNNATETPSMAPLAELDEEDFDRAIRSNIHGTFYGMKYEIEAMLRCGNGGAIVNMASGAGVYGVSNLAGYVTGKAGVIALTKVAALDYADHGIRVNVVAPGPILTHHLEAAGDEAQRQAAMSSPMRRVGRAEEVADVVTWLCSEGSSFVTVVTVPVDGGQTAGLKPPRMYRQGEPMTADKQGSTVSA